MNILLINHYAGSPLYGMEYRPYYMAREWVKAGHTVTIVASSFSHLRSTNPAIHETLTEEIIDGIRYLWIKTPPYEGNGIGRILNILSFIKHLSSYLKNPIRKEKYDAVIASSTYPLDIYPARILQKRMGSKLVFEVHDLWPLSPMELGNIPAWHPYIKLIQKAENDAYRFCDKVISILPCAAEHMIEHGLYPSKFMHIPNGILVDEEDKMGELPSEHKNVIMKLKKERRFIVGYAGAHGIANSLDTLIDAAELCAKDKITFILVGQGPEKVKLQADVSKRGLSNVIFLPTVNKMVVGSLLNLFDVCYIGLQRQPLFRFGVSPNKLMDYMLAAKPVIYAIEAGNDLVKKIGCGISVTPEDPVAIAEAIYRISSMNESERKAIGQKGKEYVLQNHDYRVIAQRFLEVLEECKTN